MHGFSTVVQLGLEALGDTMEEPPEADFEALHLAVAAGDANDIFNHWRPLHTDVYDRAGGEDVMPRVRAGPAGAGQGDYID